MEHVREVTWSCWGGEGCTIVGWLPQMWLLSGHAHSHACCTLGPALQLVAVPVVVTVGASGAALGVSPSAAAKLCCTADGSTCMCTATCELCKLPPHPAPARPVLHGCNASPGSTRRYKPAAKPWILMVTVLPDPRPLLPLKAAASAPSCHGAACSSCRCAALTSAATRACSALYAPLLALATAGLTSCSSVAATGWPAAGVMGMSRLPPSAKTYCRYSSTCQTQHQPLLSQIKVFEFQPLTAQHHLGHPRAPSNLHLGARKWAESSYRSRRWCLTYVAFHVHNLCDVLCAQHGASHHPAHPLPSNI